jgi:UDP:flavonoid glycosyltransferase YjiC (YdhE family)
VRPLAVVAPFTGSNLTKANTLDSAKAGQPQQHDGPSWRTQVTPAHRASRRRLSATAANALADVVVAHGGQGTVQTAMAAGVPIVGVGLQMEQQINLDHVMDAGAGMRIQMHRWRAPVIRRAVRTILADPTCRARAGVLAEMIRTLDGPRTAADRMWEFLLKR